MAHRSSSLATSHAAITGYTGRRKRSAGIAAWRANTLDCHCCQSSLKDSRTHKVKRYRQVAATRVALLCLLVTISACENSTPTAPTLTEPETHTLFGSVRDADNENPLEHARIELALADGSSRTTETGFPGTFAFTGVRGTLSLTVMRDGYADRSQDFDLSIDTSVQLDLERVVARSVPCGDAPDIGTRVLPILSRPFNGDFLLSTYFDHGPDNDGDLLTSCGDRVTYGGRGDGHRAYDWGAGSLPVGTPLLATFDGTVTSAGTQAPFPCTFGGTTSDQLRVEIRADPPMGYYVAYAHLDRIDVAEGQRVSSGQVIGLAGNSGCSISRLPHLHFDVIHPSRGLVDPYGWECRIPDPWARQSGRESVWLWRPGEAPRHRPCCLQ